MIATSGGWEGVYPPHVSPETSGWRGPAVIVQVSDSGDVFGLENDCLSLGWVRGDSPENAVFLKSPQEFGSLENRGHVGAHAHR